MLVMSLLSRTSLTLTDGSPPTIVDAAADFVADGFVVGMEIAITGSVSNNKTFMPITAVTTTQLTLDTDSKLVTEGPASCTVHGKHYLDGANTGKPGGNIRFADCWSATGHDLEGTATIADDGSSGVRITCALPATMTDLRVGDELIVENMTDPNYNVVHIIQVVVSNTGSVAVFDTDVAFAPTDSGDWVHGPYMFRVTGGRRLLVEGGAMWNAVCDRNRLLRIRPGEQGGLDWNAYAEFVSVHGLTTNADPIGTYVTLVTGPGSTSGWTPKVAMIDITGQGGSDDDPITQRNYP